MKSFQILYKSFLVSRKTSLGLNANHFSNVLDKSF